MYSLPSVALEQLEENLVKKAEEYEGYDNIEEQIKAEAMTHGASDTEAAAVAQKVMQRLEQLKAPKQKGNRYGQGLSYADIAKRVSEMRY